MTASLYQSGERLARWDMQWRSFEFMHDQVVRRLERLYEYVPKPQTRGDLSVGHFQGILAELHTFGTAMFHFLRHGIEGNALYGLKAPSQITTHPQYAWLASGYPVGEFLMDVLIERLVQDLLILDQAIDQRIMGGLTSTWNGLSIFDSIVIADYLASKGLDQARSLLPSAYTVKQQSGKVITYRRLNTQIRVVPYSDTALIGTSLASMSDTGASGDLLGIPHELGHFLYWNATSMTGTLRADLASRLQTNGLDPDYLWLEELFADVIGCLIGGPAAALAMQRLMLTAVGESFVRDNGHHPTPAIRPFIYIEVLRRQGQGTVANDLATSWNAVLTERNVITTTPTVKTLQSSLIRRTTPAAPSGAQPDVQAQLTTAMDYVGQILTVLVIPNVLFEPWSSGPNAASSSITDFTARAVAAANAAHQPPGPNGVFQPVQQATQQQVADTFAGITGSLLEGSSPWLQPVRDYMKASHPLDPVTPPPAGTEPQYMISADDWLTVLDAGGWLTGPGGPRNYVGD